MHGDVFNYKNRRVRYSAIFFKRRIYYNHLRRIIQYLNCYSMDLEKFHIPNQKYLLCYFLKIFIFSVYFKLYQ